MKKCPYCAEEIQDEAVVCRYCGRDLIQKPQAQTAQGIAQPQNGRKWGKIGLIAVLGILGICCILTVIGVFLSSSSNPVANEKAGVKTSTAIPTATPSSITMADIEHNYDKLTDLQWKDYVQTLKGVRIHWIGTIDEVHSDGSISLNVGQGLLRLVYLEDLPQETAKTLNKGQVIEFEATIRDVWTFPGLTIWLNNHKLISTR